MRRRAVTQRLHKESELIFDYGVGEAEDVEDALLERDIVDADRAAPELETVEHEVVVLRAHRERIGLEQRLLTGERCGKGMMRRNDRAGIGVAFEERKIDDPAK